MVGVDGSDDQPRDDEPNPVAVRLTFAFSGDRLSLESRQDVDMTPIASDTGVEEEAREPGEPGELGDVAQLGFRVDVVDAEGRVLYRQAARHLIPESLEFPTGDPERPLARQWIDLQEGSFDVVVPVLEGAQDVVLYRGPREQQVLRGEAEPVFREVLRVPLMSPPPP